MNWQQSDWPHFSSEQARLRKAEEQFLVGSGVFAGTAKHLLQADREQVAIEAISREALSTSEIEEEIPDRVSVHPDR